VAQLLLLAPALHTPDDPQSCYHSNLTSITEQIHKIKNNSISHHGSVLVVREIIQQPRARPVEHHSTTSTAGLNPVALLVKESATIDYLRHTSQHTANS
jgi:hypothetical protein